jgi:hypothetical protein
MTEINNKLESCPRTICLMDETRSQLMSHLHCHTPIPDDERQQQSIENFVPSRQLDRSRNQIFSFPSHICSLDDRVLSKFAGRGRNRPHSCDGRTWKPHTTDGGTRPASMPIFSLPCIRARSLQLRALLALTLRAPSSTWSRYRIQASIMELFASRCQTAELFLYYLFVRNDN